MTEAPPITYPAALETVKLWLFHIRRMGPDAHGMTREKYVGEVDKLERVQKLLEAIIEHKAARQTSGAR